MTPRKSDTPDTATQERTRRSRFSETSEGWFFITREGVPVGPYETRFDAELSASLLISRLAQTDGEAGNLAMIHSFLSDPANPLANKRACATPRRPAASGRAIAPVALTPAQRALAALREISLGWRSAGGKLAFRMLPGAR